MSSNRMSAAVESFSLQCSNNNNISNRLRRRGKENCKLESVAAAAVPLRLCVVQTAAGECVTRGSEERVRTFPSAGVSLSLSLSFCPLL